MRIPVLAKVSAGMAVVLTVLAACVVVEEPRPLPPAPGPGPRPDFCTREYDPVCATRGGDTRTFGNACVADSEGYRIIYGGECVPERPPQACTMIYAPVCAVRGGERRTFGNECFADAEGYRIIYDGECRRAAG